MIVSTICHPELVEGSTLLAQHYANNRRRDPSTTLRMTDSTALAFASLLHGYEQNTNYANYTNKGLHCNQLLLSYFSLVGKINKKK